MDAYTNGQQTLSSATSTAFGISGGKFMIMLNVSSETYIGYNSDVDNTDGFKLTADRDYVFQVNGQVYLYAASGATITYFTF